MEWDQYFISEAYLAARKSKDKSTQVGAVIVGPDKEIRSKGYNGPPRNFDDSDASIFERPLKYALFCHAEENAITNCARIGVSSRDCSMYATMYPCATCARMIAQSGIKHLVLHREAPIISPLGGWDESFKHATRILDETGVAVRWWSGKQLIPEIRVGGKIHYL